MPLDEAVRREVIRVVQPAALEAARLAGETVVRSDDEVLEVLRRDLQAAQYAERRAQKQFDTADPENRLVADALKRRWEETFRQVRDLEARIAQREAEREQSRVPSTEDLSGLANDMERLWAASNDDPRLKKRIVQTLVEEIVRDSDPTAGHVRLVIQWKGGIHTELSLPHRRRGCCTASTAEVVEAVRKLVRVCGDAMIAGILNRHGLRTGRGNRWTQTRLAALRVRRSIRAYRRSEPSG